MSERTVDWAVFRAPSVMGEEAEGLRERKKRQTRQLLSDTATQMFLERGFEGVRVSEIAAACGVSEKTVFNYFPAKESLLLDRWDAMADALLTTLADTEVPPVAAAQDVLARELAAITSWLGEQDDFAAAASAFGRFGALLRSTPSLRAHQHELTERLAGQVAEILAKRASKSPGDPEPQITAHALLGLWPIQYRSLGRHLVSARSADELFRAVTADVRRAARVLAAGLG
jgi:AcrR family transcriptional regulator